MIFAKSRQEFRAARKIGEQGFETFLPLCRTLKDPSPKPLFARYLFVWIPPNKPWRPILNTPGVSDILRCTNEGMGGAQLAQVADSVIAQIKTRMEEDGGAILVGNKGPLPRAFKPGQHIRIIGGVNIGLEGFYVSSSRDRVECLLNMFGRTVKMTMPERYVA